MKSGCDAHLHDGLSRKELMWVLKSVWLSCHILTHCLLSQHMSVAVPIVWLLVAKRHVFLCRKIWCHDVLFLSLYRWWYFCWLKKHLNHKWTMVTGEWILMTLLMQAAAQTFNSPWVLWLSHLFCLIPNKLHFLCAKKISHYRSCLATCAG